MYNESIIKRILEEKGHKLTNQRKDILSLIYLKDNHLTVKDIYKDIKVKKIGLATVYRTLNLFSDLKLVNETNINGTRYFEKRIFSKKTLHIHLKCCKCNSIIDIYESDININLIKSIEKIEGKYNAKVEDADIMYLGLCEDCREDK